jgi:ketosteroid isomerase-like protein
MKSIFYLLLVAVTFITACQPKTEIAAVDTLAEADAIRKLENQWTIAFRAGDVDKVISFYAIEAVSMKPNRPIIDGIQAIRKETEAMFSDTTQLFKTYSIVIDTIEVSASGDLAYVRGTDRLSIKTLNESVEDAAKWVDIWKKINGEWKIIVNIWNSERPSKDK